MRAAWGGLISPVLFSLYVNDVTSPSHHVELALYVDESAIIATSRKPTLFVSYLESNLNDLQMCVNEWRSAINVCKSTAIIFARAELRFFQPRPLSLFGESIQLVDTTLGLPSIHDSTGRLTSARSGKTAQRMGMLGPP
jgi:hypothetical protein